MKRIKALSVIVSILLLFALCGMADAAALFNYPKFRATTSTGSALSGGKLYTYAPGTSTLKATYADRAKVTANANPIVLDSNGEATIYLDGNYKMVLKSSAGVTQWTMDSVSGITPTAQVYEVDALDYGSGDYTQATITAALAAIGTTNKATLILRPGTWVISSNADWSAYTNITIKMPAGSLLQIATGTTTTIGGPFEAGMYQVLNCVGTGKIVFGTRSINHAYPHWIGVVPNDNTARVTNTALLEKLVAVGSGVNKVVFPATLDTWYFESFTLPQKPIFLQGGATLRNDSGATLDFSPTGTNAIIAPLVTPQLSRFSRLEGLIINTGLTKTAIYVGNGGLLIDKVWVKASGIGLHVAESYGGSYTNIGASAAISGVKIGDGSGRYVSINNFNNIVVNNYVTTLPITSGIGIWFAGTGGNVHTANTFTNIDTSYCYDGIKIEGNSTQNTFTNVWAEQNYGHNIYYDKTELMTLDTAGTPGDFPDGATITGVSSGATCVVDSKLSSTSYRVKERSGTFTYGEVIGDGTNTADQGAGCPYFASLQGDYIVNHYAGTGPSAGVPAADHLSSDLSRMNANGIEMSTILLRAWMRFPATQVPSSDVNTLDDYREGTWTPVINRGGGGWTGTYTSRTGTYVKIGKLVFVYGKVVIASITGASSGVNIIQGLPFAGASVADGLGVVSSDSAFSAADVKSTRVNGSNAYLEFQSTAGAEVDENWAAGTIEFTATYIAAN